jgi:hypothetical protein
MCAFPRQDVTHQDLFAIAKQAVYYMLFPLPFERPNPTITCAAINQQFSHLHIGVHYMANAKKGAKTDYAAPNDLKWINRNLTDQEKKHHDGQEKSPSELGVLIFTVSKQGYNFRVGWDGYSKCYQANLVPFQAENPNYGYAISARGVTPERAVSLLLYKHYAVFEEKWSAFYQAPSQGFEG